MADLDAGVETLDTFSLLLPLPYRLTTVVVLGIWLWGVNLQVLHRHGIDTPSLIRYPAHGDPPIHLSVYRFATVLSAPLVISLLFFSALTHGGQQERVVAFQLLPNITLVLVFALAFIIPHRWLYPRSLWPTDGRTRLLRTFRRISIGGLARTEDGKFGDVLLADALTSYARPLSEVYIALSMMFTRRSTTGKIDRSSTVAVPILLAVPFLIRFRQCLLDNQPYNAAKYATAFPAILLSTLMRLNTGYFTSGNLSGLWMIAALTNALYSFYWDVARDWDLTLFSPRRSSQDCKYRYPFGLRRTRIFEDVNKYYAMIAVDLVLRFAWALKLSPHLEHYYDIESGIFLLEALEVVRRFLWVFFRVETEWVRTRHSSEIMLGDLGPKLDVE